VMMGLGTSPVNAVITPVRSGKVHITCSGWMNSGTSSGQTQAALRYGTGAAPINGAGPAGVLVPGCGVPLRGPLGSTVPESFSISGIVTGLTLGQTIWIDMMVDLYAGTASVISVP
jgi:hypothetical protein